MKPVLIISTNTQIEEGLAKAAKAQGRLEDFRFDTTASFGQDAAWWLNEGPVLLVIKMPADEVLQAFFIRKLMNDVPKNLPLIFVADSISGAFLELSSAFKKVRTFKNPVDTVELFGLIQDMLLVRPPSQQQRHQRYNVELQAKMHLTEETSKIFDVQVKNLSLGGALLVGDKKLGELEVASRIRIEISSNENEFAHGLEAEIVWVRSGELGVKFIQSEES